MKKLIIFLLVIGTVWYLYHNNFEKKELAVSSTNTVKIKNLITNSYDYDGKTVQVLGIVSDSYNLGFVKFYRMKDKSGESIWINTDYICPPDGSRVKVTGRFKQLFKVGDKEMPVIIESEKAKIIKANN